MHEATPARHAAGHERADVSVRVAVGVALDLDLELKSGPVLDGEVGLESGQE